VVALCLDRLDAVIEELGDTPLLNLGGCAMGQLVRVRHLPAKKERQATDAVVGEGVRHYDRDRDRDRDRGLTLRMG
jgi:hypothetical protein